MHTRYHAIADIAKTPKTFTSGENTNNQVRNVLSVGSVK